jgi:hypothetical protein
VQVSRVSEQSSWQREYQAFAEKQQDLLEKAKA